MGLPQVTLFSSATCGSHILFGFRWFDVTGTVGVSLWP